MHLASGGLFVIGGDTTNLVGLGGCNAADYIDASTPFYCNTRVMRSPTMWLGIFTGGCVSISVLSFGWCADLRPAMHWQNFHGVPYALSRQGLAHLRYLPHVHHFVAALDGRDGVPPYRGRGRGLRFFQTGRHLLAAKARRKCTRCRRHFVLY